MSPVAVVAIPSENDYVWKISSEKVPHLTILTLGDMTPGPEMARIEDFLQHLVNTSMHRFGMSVDHRGTLGPQQADVLFLDNEHPSMISRARMSMLQDSPIRLAYNSADQYPEWTPHVTLGYPATPAHEDTREYPGIGWINFEKIALWVDDYSGPEFLLKEQGEVGLAMSEMIDNVLAHHGVKGMKWGVRKEERNSPNVTIRTNPARSNRVKVTGGKGHPIHEDAASALTSRQKAKASGVHTLSNAELKKLVERMNMEQQYSRMAGKPKGEGRKFAEEQMKNLGRQKIAATLAKNAARTAAVAAVVG